MRTMKGELRGQALATTAITTTGPGSGKAIHAFMYGKVQAGPREKEKKGKKLVVLPKLRCLATYIGYVSRVSAYLC